MVELFAFSPYFGAALTIGFFCLAVIINKKWSYAVTTPLLLGIVFVSAVLVMFGISYDEYNMGAKYLTYLLVPLTVCFAVPMYKQLPLLKKHALPILGAVCAGVVASVFSVAFICLIFGIGDIFAKSFVAISSTTAIAIGITEKLGGVVAFTVSAVVVTGVLGASVSDIVCKILRLKNPISRGLAIGNASHAAGTVKAMQMGKIEGAMSALAIVLSGLMTAIVAPIAIYLLF